MATTHGGRSRDFDWKVRDKILVIDSESGMHHEYSLREILSIIHALHAAFGKRWIPLANNVEKMYSGTEKEGLGTTIYALKPGDTAHAQGASYLGVILEITGIFEWNGEKKGIAWRFEKDVDDIESLHQLLKRVESSDYLGS